MLFLLSILFLLSLSSIPKPRILFCDMLSDFLNARGAVKASINSKNIIGRALNIALIN